MDISFIVDVVSNYFIAIYSIMFSFNLDTYWDGARMNMPSLYYLVVIPFAFFCIMIVFKKVYLLWK